MLKEKGNGREGDHGQLNHLNHGEGLGAPVIYLFSLIKPRFLAALPDAKTTTNKKTCENALYTLTAEIFKSNLVSSPGKPRLLWVQLAPGRARMLGQQKLWVPPREALGLHSGRAAGAATAPKGRGACERKQLRGPGRRLGQFENRPSSHGGGATPKGRESWAGPDQLGLGDNRGLTPAWRQAPEFQRLPLDHNSRGSPQRPPS